MWPIILSDDVPWLWTITITGLTELEEEGDPEWPFQKNDIVVTEIPMMGILTALVTTATEDACNRAFAMDGCNLASGRIQVVASPKVPHPC